MTRPQRQFMRGLDRDDPGYRAAVRAAADQAATPDGATVARLRAVLAAPPATGAETKEMAA